MSTQRYRMCPKWHHTAHWPILLAVLLAAGCTGAKGPPGADKGGPLAPVDVSGETITIQSVPWPTLARVQGSLSADEVTTMAAKIFGRVVEVHCDLGDAVAVGEQLVKIDDREFKLRVVQAEAQLAQARAAVGLKAGDPVSGLDPLKAPPVRETKALLDEAKQQVARLKTLFAQRAIVATDLEAALSAEQVADARFNSSLNAVREKMAIVDVQAALLDLARQSLSDTVVTAPLDGVVLNRSVAVGTYIQVGQPIVELAKTSVLRYRAAVPERFAQQLQIGQQVRLNIAGELRETTVSRISPALDPLSRSLVFEALVANEDRQLRSGLFAQAEIVLDAQAATIAVPESALVRFAGVDKVWRVAGGKVSEAPLQIGRQVADMIEVFEGLSVGDQILRVGSSGRSGNYLGAEPQKINAVKNSEKAPELIATKVSKLNEPESRDTGGSGATNIEKVATPAKDLSGKPSSVAK